MAYARVIMSPVRRICTPVGVIPGPAQRLRSPLMSKGNKVRKKEVKKPKQDKKTVKK